MGYRPPFARMRQIKQGIKRDDPKKRKKAPGLDKKPDPPAKPVKAAAPTPPPPEPVVRPEPVMAPTPVPVPEPEPVEVAPVPEPVEVAPEPEPEPEPVAEEAEWGPRTKKSDLLKIAADMGLDFPDDISKRQLLKMMSEHTS